MPPSIGAAKHRREAISDVEVFAVQNEIDLPSASLEALHLQLGVLPGIHLLDEAYAGAWRELAGEEEQLQSFQATGDFNDFWLRWPRAALPTAASAAFVGSVRHSAAHPGPGGASSAGDSSLDAAGSPLPGPRFQPLGLSWQQRLAMPQTKALCPSGPGRQPAAPAVANATTGAGADAAARLGPEAAEAAVPGGAPEDAPKPPAPKPVHLGMGVVLNAHGVPRVGAQPPPSDGAGDVGRAGNTSGAPAVGQHGGDGRAAAKGRSRTGGPGRLVKGPLTASTRVGRLLRDVFREDLATRDADPALSGVLLPPWFAGPPAGLPPPRAAISGRATGGAAQGFAVLLGRQYNGADQRPEGPTAATRNPAAVPLPREPLTDSAPYGELLNSVQRLGYDLCRHGLQDPAAVAAAGSWHAMWTRVIHRVLDQMRRLLHARSAVSKYGPGLQAAQGPDSGQPLASHSQLRDAVQLLLIVAAELPPGRGPRAGVAPEAWDAMDFLLCSSPFADFDGCDPQARAILVGGALQLARLAAERAATDPSWWEPLARALQTLCSWLKRQSDVVRQLRSPLLEGTGPEGQAGFRWEAAPGRPLLEDERQRPVALSQRGHIELLLRMVAAMAMLPPRMGAPLALQLTDRDLLDSLLAPDAAATAPHSSLDRQRAETVLMLHSALEALLRGGSGSAGQGQGPIAADRGAPGEAVGGASSGLLLELRVRAEQVLRAECRAPDQLLVQEPEGEADPQAGRTAAMSCRDAVVPLLGSLYAALFREGALATWAAVESAVHGSATEVAYLQPGNPLRKAWEAGCDQRNRSLALHTLAQVTRALNRLGADSRLSAALRSDAPGTRPPAAEQLGLLAVWLRAALDCTGRPMLAALTAELLRCREARTLFSGGDTEPTALAIHVLAPGQVPPRTPPLAFPDKEPDTRADEALTCRVAAAVAMDPTGTSCARLAAALMTGLVRARRFADVRGVTCGLDLCYQAALRDLDRTCEARSAAGDAGPQGALVPPGSLADGGGPAGSLGALLPALRSHRAMAMVALAAGVPCAGGSLVRHAAAVASAGGAPGGSGRGWPDLQGTVRVLQCVAETVVLDAAALVRWCGGVARPGEAEQGQRWHERLLYDSSVGLLSDFVVVLTRSADCRTDYALDPAHPSEHSVLQRCIALVCLMVSELPSPSAEHAVTNGLLQSHTASAWLDHLWPEAAAEPDRAQHVPPHGYPGSLVGPSRGGALQGGDAAAAARDNLARMLHRCITGSLRFYVLEGLKVVVPQSAQARHAVNALTWLRTLLEHPSLGQMSLLERLLPPMLNLVAESLAASRALLLSRGLLQYDAEAAAVADQAPRQQQQQASAHPPPLALIRQLLDTCAAVLATATRSGLVAPKGEAYNTAQGAVRIDASPLALMEPAPRHQLRAAAGFTLGLLLRTCLECFSLPMAVQQQQAMMSAARPPPEERSLRVSLRLASCLGTPPALSETERPSHARRRCGADVLKLSGAPAEVDGADGPVKLSEAGAGCITRLAQALDHAGYTWALPVVEGMRQLVKDMQALGVSLTIPQRQSILAVLRHHKSRDPRQGGQAGLQAPPPPPPQIPHGQPAGAGPPQQQQPGKQQQQQQQQQQQPAAPVAADVRQQVRQRVGAATPRGNQTTARAPSPRAHPEGAARRGVDGDGADSLPAPGRATSSNDAVPGARRAVGGPSHRPGGATRRADEPTQQRGNVAVERQRHQAAVPVQPQASPPPGSERPDGQPSGLCTATGDTSVVRMHTEDASPQGAAARVYGNHSGSQQGDAYCCKQLAGSLPFADLPAVLIQTPQGLSNQSAPDRDSQADGAGSPSPKASVDMPPVVGQVVDAKVVPIKGNQRVLQMSLRDASTAGVPRAVTVYIAGPPDTLEVLREDVTRRKATAVGVFGAYFLGSAARSSRAPDSSQVASPAAPWPLLAKLTLDTSASCKSRPCGVVVEPRIQHTHQAMPAAAPWALESGSSAGPAATTVLEASGRLDRSAAEPVLVTSGTRRLGPGLWHDAGGSAAGEQRLLVRRPGGDADAPGIVQPGNQATHAHTQVAEISQGADAREGDPDPGPAPPAVHAWRGIFVAPQLRATPDPVALGATIPASVPPSAGADASCRVQHGSTFGHTAKGMAAQQGDQEEGFRTMVVPETQLTEEGFD